jgi:hypothetical protein
MGKDIQIGMVRRVRDAYQDGIAEGERRSAAKVAELEARIVLTRATREKA